MWWWAYTYGLFRAILVHSAQTVRDFVLGSDIAPPPWPLSAVHQAHARPSSKVLVPVLVSPLAHGSGSPGVFGYQCLVYPHICGMVGGPGSGWMDGWLEGYNYSIVSVIHQTTHTHRPNHELTRRLSAGNIAHDGGGENTQPVWGQKRRARVHFRERSSSGPDLVR